MSSFAAWPRDMPPGAALFAVEVPRETGEAESEVAPGTAQTVQALMPGLVKAFLQSRTEQPDDLPFMFYGHSLGALIAFELVRTLRRIDYQLPAMLIVSGRRAPACPLRGKPLWDLPRDELLFALEQMGGLTPELLAKPKWQDFVMPTLRAQLMLSDMYGYIPEPPLPFPIHAFRGEQDPILTQQEITAWCDETSATCRVQALPGAHFFDDEGIRHLRRDIALELEALASPLPLAIEEMP